jgi:hypothetical protein
MKARIAIDEDRYTTARHHLDDHPERIGFFLADWSEEGRMFSVTAWMPIDDNQVSSAEGDHVALADEAQTAVISWARTEGSCLVEAHSHGGRWPASFSPTDTAGFEEWVPHLWWRLRGKPYAAIVTAEKTLDALAWIEGSDDPEQVDCIVVGGTPIRTTGDTLRRGFTRDSGLDG